MSIKDLLDYAESSTMILANIIAIIVNSGVVINYFKKSFNY